MTKIGTRDSDTTLKVKMSKVKVTRPLYSARPQRVRRLQRSALERIGGGKLLLRCVCSARDGGGEERGHIVSPRAQLVLDESRTSSANKQYCLTSRYSISSRPKVIYAFLTIYRNRIFSLFLSFLSHFCVDYQNVIN